MTTYLDEEIPKQEQLAESIRFSTFLQWASKRVTKETNDASIQATTDDNHR